MNINMKTVKLEIFTQSASTRKCLQACQISLPSSISYWGTEGVPKWKLGAADLLRRPLADKFLHVAIVPANAYQRTKF